MRHRILPQEPQEDCISIHSDSDIEIDVSSSSKVIVLDDDGPEEHNGKSDMSSEVVVILSDNENDDCEITGQENFSEAQNSTASHSKNLKQSHETNNSAIKPRRSSRARNCKIYGVVDQNLDNESEKEKVIVKGRKKKTKVAFIDKPKQNKYDLKNAIILDSPLNVTPVSSENIQVNPDVELIQSDTQPLLPTLRDDMFVVEAPSFICPYIYEAPAPIHLITSMELALLEKKSKEADSKQECQKKRERREVVETEPEEPEALTETNTKSNNAENRGKQQRKKQDDYASWEGASSSKAHDSLTGDESGNVLVTNKVHSLEDKKTSKTEEDAKIKTDNYFHLSLGNFFMGIGDSLVQEYVQTDLLKQQKQKMLREKKSGRSTIESATSIALLSKNLEMSQQKNQSFKFEMKKCNLCTFKTESELVLQHHMEMYHMENDDTRGRRKRKLAKHQVAPTKGFTTTKGFETNLAPPTDCECPAKLQNVVDNQLQCQVSQDHYTKYKCSECVITFSSFNLYENHVYTIHNDGAIKDMEKDTKSEANIGNQLRIDDEVGTKELMPFKVPAPKKRDLKMKSKNSDAKTTSKRRPNRRR